MDDINVKLRERVFYKEDKELDAFGKTTLDLNFNFDIDNRMHWFEFTILIDREVEPNIGNLNSIIYFSMLRLSASHPNCYIFHIEDSMNCIYNTLKEIIVKPGYLYAIKVDKERKDYDAHDNSVPSGN